MPRSKFRPCIDLHNGQVKQIVGGTLNDQDPEKLLTNFVSSENSGYYAKLYKQYNLTGGHIIKLGAGNNEAAKEALETWPGGLQIGGGITLDNAQEWIDYGADKIILTSYLFPDAKFSFERLKKLSEKIGKDKIVIDLRKVDDKWFVAMNKWQTITDMEVNKESIDLLSNYCSEFLIHSADVEGLCQGIDSKLVECLGEWVNTPTTYAGGANSIKDLALVDRLSNGKVDLTFGSALDIFGGNKVKFQECVLWNQQELKE
nr:5304_t:CDS:10 [Entrophospora candida]CAG8585040.1 1337_t:CDS:10 [Entrophospora candida]